MAVPQHSSGAWLGISSCYCPARWNRYDSVTPWSLLLLSGGRPHMYIDPTTGSLVLQFLAAGVLSVLAMASRVREAVKSFFKMLLPRRRR